MLREAACRTVRDNALRLTGSLMNRAMNGDANCARVFLSLVEKRPEKEATSKKKRCRSIALELAAEPQWKELGNEAAAGAGAVVREREC